MPVHMIPEGLRPQFLWYTRRRRLGRRALHALDALITAPANLATPLALPAGVELALSHSVGATLGQITLSLGNGASGSTPVLAANQISPALLYAEQGQTVTLTGAPTGTTTLWAIDPLSGERLAIGTRVVV